MKNSDVSQAYDHFAEIYERRWSFYVERSNAETLKRLQLGSTDKLLDIGCGTGVLLGKIAKKSPSTLLYGIDASSEMLNIARSKNLNADLRTGSVESLPYDSNCFDKVVSVSSLHYWQEPEISMKEIHRILKPGGEILITDWCDDYFLCKLCDFYLRLFDKAHQKTYTTTGCKKLLESSGFSNVEIEKYKINWFWGFFTIQGLKPIS